MSFAPGIGRVITSGTDPALTVWDIATGRETIALAGHTRPASSLVAWPRKLRVYSAGLDGTVRLWEGLDPGPAAGPPRPRSRIVD
jgi:WD40 repeat protein